MAWKRMDTNSNIYVFIFFLELKILNTKIESNIIKYRREANTNRREYGNEYFLEI